MFDVLALILASVFPVLGFVSDLWTYARWRFLVDPPDDLFWSYSHSFLKRFIGRTGLIYYNYIVGTLLIAGFVYAVIQSLIDGR